MKKLVSVVLVASSFVAPAIGESACGRICEMEYWSSGVTQDDLISELEQMPDVNARHQYGWTALSVAASFGNLNAAKLLIERGANLNIADNWGNTALISAVFGGNPDLVELLVINGADVTIKGNVDDVDITAGELAAQRGYTEIAALLDVSSLDISESGAVQYSKGATEPGMAVSEPKTANLLLTELEKIRQNFDVLIGVDAEGFQMILVELGLLENTPDGVWGPATEAAVLEMLKLADDTGIVFDASTVDTMFQSMFRVKDAAFDPNSGLSATPFEGAYLLVVASRSSYDEAQPISSEIEANLAAVGFAKRTGLFPTLTGVVAVTAGMYPQERCDTVAAELKLSGLIPKDAYCTSVTRFDPMAWTN